MRDDQICGNCEWWDTRNRSDDPSASDQLPCLRWPGRGPDGDWLWTSEEQRCWQWCAKGKGGNNPPIKKMHPDDVKQAVLDPELGGAYRAIRTKEEES